MCLDFSYKFSRLHEHLYWDFGNFEKIFSSVIISIEVYNVENVWDAESLVLEMTREFWIGED